MSSPSLARRERHALCELALVLGEDAPTLCGDWDAKGLVTHLLVRESRPLGAAGILVPALAGLTERSMRRMGRTDFGVLVERLRDPGLTPYALPAVETMTNTLEYFVHHEDLRRAQPGWEPRALDEDDRSRLWSLVRVAGLGLTRSVDVPVRIRRSDTGESAGLGGGSEGRVTVVGPVPELVLFLFGRDQVRELDFEGPPDAVERLRGEDLGL